MSARGWSILQTAWYSLLTFAAVYALTILFQRVEGLEGRIRALESAVDGGVP